MANGLLIWKYGWLIMPNSSKYYTSKATPNDWKTLPNLINFNIDQKLLSLQTSMPVLVQAVHPNTAFTGTVDVFPMLQQVGNDGTLWDYSTLYNLPYTRIQGGVNGIIIDPAINDIGIAIFASRDITTVKNTRKKGKPGSYRSYDLADGMYLGGILNNTPTRFIQFTDTGIVITANTTLTINGDVTVNGSITATGDVVGQGTSLHTHTHSDPQGGNTGAPN